MSDNNIIGSELSVEVKSLSGLAMLIDYAACFDHLMACIPCGRPLTIQERRKLLFAATDRFSLKDEEGSNGRGAEHRNYTYDYDMPREVLELVLSQNHCIGDSISEEAGVIVEMPDQIQFIPGRPPLPKGSFQKMQDSVHDLVNLLSMNPTQIPDRQKDRWDPAEQRAFELILSHCGRVRSEQMSKQVSLFVRHATHEEVAPYHVDFHLSQKAWYERVAILMVQSTNAYQERAATGIEEYQKNDRVRMEAANAVSEQIEKKPIPEEIALKERRAEKKKHSSRVEPEEEAVITSTESTPQKNVWIPDFDVVLGVQTSITTVATQIFEDRVLPVYSSKMQLRESHIKIMKLMLEEELKDEANIVDDDIDMPESKFWVKMSEVEEDLQNTECKASDNTESKWLRLENGDFVGPFVAASTASLQRAVDDWRCRDSQSKIDGGQRDPEPSFSMAETAPPADEEPSLGGKQRDPEPSFSALEAAPTDEEQEDPPIEDIRPALSKGYAVTALSAKASDPSRPPLFNMDGPLDTLGEEARKLCQKWVDDSETLLVKAAKKSMIDTFQSDFHSFLFLFQVQMKRIKGGDLSSKSCGSKEGISDDCSWVSAEPSVAEEDTRVEDIEKACTAFMNRMGNNMVTQYEKLAGVDSTVPVKLKEEACEAPLVSLFSDDTRDDQVVGVPSAEASGMVKTSLNVIKGSVSSGERQGSPTSVNHLVEERQPESRKERHYLYPERNSVINDHTFTATEEIPEKSAVENVKSVSFDLQESGNKLKVAIMQLEKQRRRETPKRRPEARKYQRNAYNIDFSDEDEDDDESSTKSSTRSCLASDSSPSFDTYDTFEPSLETSFDSTKGSRSYERTVSYRSHSRTFSTEYADGEYDVYDDDDDDTFPTFDSRRDDDFEDDDTFPTFDSRRNDSVTLSPSEQSFEEFFKKNEEQKSSWLPTWFA